MCVMKTNPKMRRASYAINACVECGGVVEGGDWGGYSTVEDFQDFNLPASL